jgi:monoamine oxidase
VPSRRIVVIGAGLAGLTVADELHRRGFEVCLLEARARVGGRCHTVGGVDMGAHWIHGTEGNPITGLARRLGLPTVFVGGDSTFTGGWDAVEIRGASATTFDGDDKLASVLAADEMWDALEVFRRNRVAAGDDDLSLADAVAELRRNGRLASESLNLDWHLELLAREDAGCGSAELSLISWDEGVDVYGYGDSVLAGGYGPLTEALAGTLDVRLETIVRTIDASDPAQVRITTVDGDVIVGDAVVVTVPLGVLKAGVIDFVPPLPHPKQTAIDRLGVGVLAKLVLRFDDVWWREDQYVFGVACAPIDRWPTVIINTAATQRDPVLVVLAGGDLGRWIETAPIDEVANWSAGLIAEVFGPEAPLPTGIERTTWSTDPHALGSYSAMVVGATAAHIRALAEPHGPVHFAGEATSESNWSTAHGAVLSGRREAARIAGDPSIASERFISETRRWRRQQQRVMRFHNAVSGQLSGEQLEERLELMGLNSAFDDVPPRDLEALASMLDEQFHEAGSVLCRVGVTASEVFIIVDGELTAFLPETIRRSTMGRGDMVGELGLFVHRERTADLVVTEPCRLLVLDYDRFRRFLLAFPEASLALLGASITRLTDAERRSVAAQARSGDL